MPELEVQKPEEVVEESSAIETPVKDDTKPDTDTKTDDTGETVADPNKPAEGSAPSETKPEDSKGVQDRINKVIKERGDAERKLEIMTHERNGWRDDLLERERVEDEEIEPDPDAVDTPKEDPEPKVDDFPDYDDYLKASAKWNTKVSKAEILEAVREENALSQQERDEKAAERIIEEEENSIKTEGKKAHADFVEVALAEAVPYSEIMKDAVFESPNRVELAYYLGSHLDDASRISELSDIKAVMELGKIEAKILANKTDPDPDRKTTKALDPINPVGSTEEGKKELKDLSYEEYCKRRGFPLKRR